MKIKTYPEECKIAQSTKHVTFVIFRKNGLIIDNTPFFSLILSGFEKECRKNNAEMLMTTLNQRDNNFKLQLKKLKEEEETGITILGTELSDEDLGLFLEFHSPVVLLDSWDKKMRLNSVSILNEEAAKQAVSELIKNGHTKIGYLKGRFRIKGFQEREQGIQKQLALSGLNIHSEYIIELPTTMEGACIEMKQYLSTNPRLPTAFFADNDMIALGVMKALREYRIEIPEQVSIIGVDDLPFSRLSSPNLTSLRIPKQEMGKMAADRLFNLMEQRDTSISRIQISAELVKRDSIKTIESKKEELE